MDASIQALICISPYVPLPSWTCIGATLHYETRWYNFETLSQTDDFCRAAVESVHIVQSVHLIARWKAK